MNGERVFFISDPHFDHKNIIQYSERPFVNLREMEDKIIENWNKVVKRNDTVWILGDVFFGTEKEKAKEIMKKLRGKKKLVKGNHDRKTNGWYFDVGFCEVYDKPVCLNWLIWLSHEPMPMSDDLPYKNIHGHMHLNVLDSKNHLSVCVEQTGYVPIQYEDALQRFGIEDVVRNPFGRGGKYNIGD